MHKKEYTLELAGKTIVATFSDLAEQAHGSVMLRCEDTVVLATACMSKDGKSNPGFFNLTVEYLEKFYASGMILGGQYNKREGRPSDEAILTSRVIDRTIRPLFDRSIKNAVQVITTVLSVGNFDPGILAINAASLALGVSDIPWNGPVGAVLVSAPKGTRDLVVNNYLPNTGETNYSLDFTLCGKENKVLMIEALAYEYTEEELDRVLDVGMEAVTALETWQKMMIKEIGKAKKDIPSPVVTDEIKNYFNETIEIKIKTNIFGPESKKYIYELEDEWKELVSQKWEDDEDTQNIAKDYYHHVVDELVHKGALEENKRVDGRAMDQVRDLYGEVGTVSKLLHGTGIFYRGETHVLSVLTLGGPETAQTIEGMEIRGTKRFMHHYNFPPYSAGETGRLGGINRREMGHGFLVEKALTPVIPDKLSFPYTIRVVSESTASNGSTSQASICASSLALMDGGVPITRPVAGIAIGLILDEKDEKNYRILTDIQGPEDHHGDMDFKVGGTREGVTALQLDIKVGGIPIEILKEALRRAKEARYTILDTIERVIPVPRKTISPYAPEIRVIKIAIEQIGMVIGSGGKTVKEIREKTGAEITIEDDGTVYCVGREGAAQKAEEIILAITKEWKEGDNTVGEVIKVLEIGAVVKISPFADGLVHISELASFRVNKVSDLVHEGMRVPVTVIGVDKEKDRISLSIKKANKDFFKEPPATTQPKTV